jgi:hypothetical protein
MSSKEAIGKVSDYWLQLLNDTLPKIQPGSTASIIELNQGEMLKLIDKLNTSLTYMSIETLEKFMSKEKYWSVQKKEYTKRIDLLRTMLEYRKKYHIEMLDLHKFRMIVDVKKLKCIFSKSHFINHTVQENSFNSLLTLQGYFLKNFIYFHLRHDMRFKASIDSYMIEMDNPMTRQTIREENKKDEFLSKKYLSTDPNGLNVEQFCEHLLVNFFPKISGIWADHSQMAPMFFLQFIRICFEYGLISSAKAKYFLELLVKATVNLMKLEEGWVENPTDDKKFSYKLKLYNVTTMLAKCREHIAAIIINILVLLTDEYFMEKFTEYVETDATKEKIIKDLSNDFVLFDKSINDSVLFITMNYLSNNVEILCFKSTTEFSLLAVEKIFFHLTRSMNDCFLNSLKQISRKDLQYISIKGKDPISSDLREMADTMGYTLRALIHSLGMGYYDKKEGILNTSATYDQDFEQYVKKYITGMEVPTLELLFKKIAAEIRDKSKIEEDYKVALVKESVPLRLVAFAHYCCDYLDEPAYKRISRELFSLIADLSHENNFCKAQLFKYDSLFHLRKLLKTFDLDAFMLLFKICKELNASVFLGKEVFNMFLELYERFNNAICKDLNIDSPAENMNMENFATLIMMTKYMHLLFSRPFLNENDKLQNMILAQEGMFKSMATKYLPMLISQTEAQSNIQDERRTGTLQNTDFLEGQEMVLFEKIKQDGHDDLLSKQILANHLAFWSLKLYNKLCSFGYSFKQYELMLPFCKRLTELIESMPNFANNDWMLPFGLEAEILTFLNCFRLLPQQNILVENNMTSIQRVVGSSWLQEITDIITSLKTLAKEQQHLIYEKQTQKDNPSPEIDEKIKSLEESIRKAKSDLNEFRKKEEILIKFLLNRTKPYATEQGRQSEGQIYLYDGLLPLLFTYINSIFTLNLVETSRDSRSLFDQVNSILKCFGVNLPYMNKILSKDVFIQLDKLGIPMGEETTSIAPESINTSISPSISFAKQAATPVDVEKLEGIALQACELILQAIEDLYEGSTYSSPGSLKKDLSKEEFNENSAGAKFEPRVKLSGLELTKNKKLKYFIRAYHEAKEDYLNREEEPNLISFFDRNNQNLRGVFNSCLDRLLNRKKVERNSKKESLSYNPALSKFWTNRSVRGYIDMVAMLVSKSKTGRKELFDFLHDDQDKNKLKESENDEEEEEEQGNLPTGRDYIDKRQSEEAEGVVLNIYREDLLATMIRVHVDLVYYLNSSYSRHDVWWVTHQTYEMISMFFKNLCECNFLQFKDYLAQKTPYLRDQNWTKFAGDKTYSMIFGMEFKAVMKTTRIAVNREPVMIRSDFKDRVTEVLNPLLEIINEAIIGPCVENQKIFLNSDTTSMCNIALRLVDDVNDSFYQVSSTTLSVIIALLEGIKADNKENEESLFNELKGVLEKLASKLPASMIGDRIHRLIKKMFVRQLRLNGDYDGKVDEKEGRGFFTALTSRKKKPAAATSSMGYNVLPGGTDKGLQGTAKNQIMPVNSEMPVTEKKIAKEVGEKVEEIITEDLENSVNITHWKDLLAMYMKNKEFYSSDLFDFVFRMIVLWKNLTGFSKTHLNRWKEIDYESEVFFKNKGLFGGFSGNSKNKKSPSELCSIYYFLTKKIMCEIEVLDPNENPSFVYFPRLPATFMLADEAKRNYREGCDISDSNTKMVDLMRNFELFKIKMESNYQMADKLGIFYKAVSTDAYYYYTIFCWLIGFALNISVLVGLSYVDDSTDYVATNDEAYAAIFSLAIILISVAGLFLVLWLITRFKQTYRTSAEDYKFDRALKSSENLSFKAKLYIAVKKSFLDQPFPMSYMLHVVFTILGLTASPVFYALNLLLIINFSKTTEFVMQAIMLHIDQLALTFMLAIFVVFFFTMILMDYFFEHISVEETNLVCYELYTCFFFVLNLGFRNGGGFAESLTDLSPDAKFPGRTILDLGFFFVINVISLNIIFGIIIDTFSQLRDAQNERSKLCLT